MLVSLEVEREKWPLVVQVDEDFKDREGRKGEEGPPSPVGQGIPPGSPLLHRPAESEARPAGEAHRPEHAKPHPREQSQDPAWLGDGGK